MRAIYTELAAVKFRAGNLLIALPFQLINFRVNGGLIKRTYIFHIFLLS